MRYTVFSPDHEILGALIISYRNSVNQQNYHDLYTQMGLDNVQPDQWYPFQRLLDVFNALAEREGAMMDFVSIALASVMGSPMPPIFEQMPFTQIMLAFNHSLEGVNRGTDYGYTRVTEVEPNHMRIDARYPAPDDLLYGGIYGYAKRFLPKGSKFTLRYDESTPRRVHGGDVPVIHLTWTLPESTSV